jgi:fumarylacetoacetase
MSVLDQTHDPKLRSWVDTANSGSDFPIQNLPFGMFSPAGEAPRAGVAIGDKILDVPAALAAGMFGADARRAAEAAASSDGLNAFLALGPEPRKALRRRLSELLAAGSAEKDRLAASLHESATSTLCLPNHIGDYTDFYVGIHHATHVGKLFRPDNPLLPNYKYVPIGYHGRASSVRPSGVPPSGRLDLELELGVWIGAGNEFGDPIPVKEAGAHIGGYCLLNDWSARDIQAWEYQPLGPFLSKSFASTISPWIVTPEALAPFRIAQAAREAGDPAVLPYLFDEADQRAGAFDLALEVLLLTPKMAEQGCPAHRIAASNTKYMYWTVAQMVAHHTSNGCNLRPGDLLGTGTLSGPDRDASGSLLEASDGGRDPIHLPSGETRCFLEDGDEIILRARGCREGFVTIGFGDCRARILPAK